MSRIFSIYPLFFIFIISSSFSQEEKENFTIENYRQKIIHIFDNFRETENTSEIERVLKFLKKNEELTLHDTINSRVLYLKGAYHALSLHRYEEADKILQESFKLASKTNNRLLQGCIYNDRAVLANYIYKDYEKTEELFKKAIECFEGENNNYKLIETYYNLTANSHGFQRYQEAIEYANKCLELIDSNEDLLLYYKRIYYLMADSYIKLNNYKKAEGYINILEKKLEKSNLKNKVRTYAWFYEARADLNVTKGEYKQAVDHLKKSILSWRELNNSNIKSIDKSYDRELSLEKELRREKDIIIKDQRKILLVSFLAITLLFGLIFLLIFFFKKNKKKNDQITKLNEELNNVIIELKDNNIDLQDKKIEIENLLRLNEQSLFSRVLKISTYNDTIGKIGVEIDNYIDGNPSASVYLMTVRNKLDMLISEDELWEDFKVQFEKIRPDFFSKLKEVAPNLSINDLKHCTYVVSNLKSKEVAQLINVSPRSVETTRYRIKKKMNLEKEDSLYALLSSL
ncbi:tetratricopeptide repeat protein [Tenacibaculum sp. MAR_2009_124]|uniref:tetratricopeptide repeat protein n=1 Tax=Tenacibaculum sp. MAR_2009_124 TaxID=1250059 RepID=UPI0015A0375B|nr:tetratricopeptide repeat protein [Tenacibaculum sp. MAR_2009_124]